MVGGAIEDVAGDTTGALGCTDACSGVVDVDGVVDAKGATVDVEEVELSSF